ncbi:MAG: glycosyltransferase family 4 protein [Candidatus Nanohaloarchaea archaeon]|nr:glycosyltransferase family 4 protein [Candidatus Nanohaloarchaea archaeon]
MRVCHYANHDLDRIDPLLIGGIKPSIRHQRKALDQAGIDYTTDLDEEYDILHLNTHDPFSFRAFLQARREGTPVIHHCHTTAETVKDGVIFSNTVMAPLTRLYISYVYSRADAVVPVSDHARKQLRDQGIDTDMYVVSNGVDPDELDGYSSMEDQVHSSFDVDGETVVTLGSVYERKGVREFIEVGRQFPDTSFYWFGSKNRLLTHPRVHRWIRDAPDNVHFPGFIEDKRKAFALGDIFFPSHAESQGLALLEAMYCEMPIVCRDLPAYRGWLEDGDNCRKARRIEGFANHISELLDDEEARTQLADSAAATAQDHTLDRIGEDLHKVYRHVAPETGG